MLLSREGLIYGPSSGMNLKGLLNLLQKAKENGELHRYAEPTPGEISRIIVCYDLPYQYLDGCLARSDDNNITPIKNQVYNDPTTPPQMLRSCQSLYTLTLTSMIQDGSSPPTMQRRHFKDKEYPSLRSTTPNGSAPPTTLSPPAQQTPPSSTSLPVRTFKARHIRGATSPPLSSDSKCDTLQNPV